MFREQHYTVNGLKLNVATGPSHGPPLWFFHGLARRWQDFSPLYPHFTEQWTIHALDHRGHGRSEHAKSHYLVADYLADACELLCSSLEPVVLIGHSLGALVALGAAAQLPQIVRAVVLLDPPSEPFLSRLESTSYFTMWSAMQTFAREHHGVSATARKLSELRLPGPSIGSSLRLGDLRDSASLRFMAKCLDNLDPDAITPPLQKAWMTRFDVPAIAQHVKCPSLLVVGDSDNGSMTPEADAKILSDALQDCSRVNLRGVGHLIHWQDPATTLRLLHAFLNSL